MDCVFSRKPCRECALYRGRHYYICCDESYRGSRPPAPLPPADAQAHASPWHKEFFETAPEPGLGMDDLHAMSAEIDLDFTAADFAEECFSAAAGSPQRKPHRRYFFQIDVWGCRPDLCIVDTSGTGPSRQADAQAPLKLLEDSVFDSGGALLMAGHYPLNAELRSWLANRLGIPSGGDGRSEGQA